MQSKLIELEPDDAKARDHILESLSVCAHSHILSRKLLNRFSTATGPMCAVAGEWYDLDHLKSYDYHVPAPAGTPPVAAGERPVERVVAFVRDYLKTTKDGIVVCENWGAERWHIPHWLWPPPRVACYGDKDVFHIVTPDTTDPEQIEAAVATSHQWQTNVCSSCVHAPESDILNEAILDEIVHNTRHIFMPAFDGSGYLIWSPRP